MRIAMFKPLLVAILMMMCLISENIGDKLDVIAILIFINIMVPDEE